jgi:hypothetical protein
MIYGNLSKSCSEPDETIFQSESTGFLAGTLAQLRSAKSKGSLLLVLAAGENAA